MLNWGICHVSTAVVQLVSSDNFFNMQMVLRRKSRHRQTTMEHEVWASAKSSKTWVGWIMLRHAHPKRILRSLHVRSGSQRKGARRRCGYCWRVPRRALVGHATECRHNTDSACFGKLLGVLFQIVSSFLGCSKLSVFPIWPRGQYDIVTILGLYDYGILSYYTCCVIWFDIASSLRNNFPLRVGFLFW